MPLDKSGSKESVGKNIRTEEAAGKPHKVAVAIALSTQDRAKGHKSPKPSKSHASTPPRRPAGRGR